MSWLSAIKSLVDLIRLAKDLYLMIEERTQRKPEEVIAETAAVVQAVKQAETKDEKDAAVKRLGDLIGRM